MALPPNPSSGSAKRAVWLCAHCEKPIQSRREALVFARPSAVVHERCGPAYQATIRSIWRGPPVNRWPGPGWGLICLVVAAACVGWWLHSGNASVLILLAVFVSGPLLSRLVHWWTIERHLPP